MPQDYLDTTVIDFSGKGKNDFAWKIRNAVEGVQIFGGIGSGKTSGSGRALALKYLSLGFGGLVLTVKPDERDLWVNDYCILTGRQKDLIIVEPDGKNFFNFLHYESSTTERGKSIVSNLVQVLKTVIRAGQEKGGGKGDDPFWETALDMLITNVVTLCQMAYGEVTVDDLYNIAQAVPKKPLAAPQSEQQKAQAEQKDSEQGKAESKPETDAFKRAFAAARKKVVARVEAFKANMPDHIREQVRNNPLLQQKMIDDLVPDARMLQHIGMFLHKTYRDLNERTRSIIDFSFSGFLFSLLQDPVYSLFCNHGSTFSPDDCLKGKIILINLPVKLYYKAGQDCQVMFKYIWQRAMERRKVEADSRPVFLWADEAQNFLHEYDADYQATARASRIATVYLSQNINNYFGNMGGNRSESKVKSFLGTMGTKIFHANADLETNEYSSKLIGDVFRQDDKGSISTSAGAVNSSSNTGMVLERKMRPEEFSLLQTGGPENNWKIHAYIHVQGKKNAAGANYKPVSFDQRTFTPPESV